MGNRYLFLIEETDVAGSPGYDVANGFVISATDATDARKIASGTKDDGRSDRWLDPKQTRVRRIGFSSVKRGIVLRDFNAG